MSGSSDFGGRGADIGRRSGGERDRMRRRDGRGSVDAGAVVRGRLPGEAPEDPVELRERLETGLVRRLADPRVRVQQQMLGVLDAGPRNVVREGEPGRRLEDLAEIERAHVGRPRHLLQTQRLGEMLTDERAGLSHRRRLGGGKCGRKQRAGEREAKKAGGLDHLPACKPKMARCTMPMYMLAMPTCRTFISSFYQMRQPPKSCKQLAVFVLV